MTFPGCPDAPARYVSLSDAALEQLAGNLATLLEEQAEAARLPKSGGLVPGLHEYIDLLWMQVTEELMRRMG